MTPAQIVAVQRSFAWVTPVQEKAAELFYNRLLTSDPAMRALLTRIRHVEPAAMMTGLSALVAGLGDLPRLQPALDMMTQRLAHYGIEAQHHEAIGAALLWTLGHVLGDKFTLDVHQAWAAAFSAVDAAMKSVSHTPSAAA
jgi:nitric oxide dioxygenase